ncbi:MAG: hypothetical protein Q9169_007504 [Polycauliona sp. 2 TL-2023]
MATSSNPVTGQIRNGKKVVILKHHQHRGNWHASNTKPIQRISRLETIRPAASLRLGLQICQPVSTPTSSSDEHSSIFWDESEQFVQKDPVPQRKSLIVTLYLPKEKKSLIVILRLPRQRKAIPCSERLVTDSHSPNPRKNKGNRTEIAAAHVDDKKKRKRLCADLISVGALSNDDTAEQHYPSPVSIQSATRSCSTAVIQQPSIIRTTIEAKAAEAARFALSVDYDIENPPSNQPVTQPTVDKDLTPWTLSPPASPIDICESGHPLFVVTGDMWLDSMPRQTSLDG